MQTTMFDRVANPFSAGFSDAVSVPLGPVSLVFVSGQVGNDGSAAVTATDFAEEVRCCFANIGRALEKAGGGFADVVRITAYMTSLDDYAAYARVRGEIFPSAPPAGATVQVAGLLANARIEIDAFAAVKSA
jgi:2-iminobutanoate/2-iminopropanoate deaminase